MIRLKLTHCRCLVIQFFGHTLPFPHSNTTGNYIYHPQFVPILPDIYTPLQITTSYIVLIRTTSNSRWL